MISIYPVATEKSYTAQTLNKYLFVVPAGSSKQLIASEVAAQFNVTVEGVTTLVRKGKIKRVNRGKRAYPGKTQLGDVKYAYVTLKKGDSIKVFDDVAAEEVKEDVKEKKTAAKVEKPVETKKAGLFTKRRTGTRGDK